jgi:hypothetical protein
MPTPSEALGYMRTVSRGSPVDPRWSVPGMILSRVRHGKRRAPKDSPLGLQDVMGREDYRELRTPDLAVGDPALDFELPRLDGGPAIRLTTFAGGKPVALVFGSYT